MAFEDIREVYMTSDARPLNELSISACSLHLNCGQVITGVALPCPIVEHMCKYGNICVGTEAEDVQLGSSSVNRNRLTWLRLKDSPSHTYAKVPDKWCDTDKIRAASGRDAAAAIHMMGKELISMSIVGTDSTASVSELLAEKTQKLEFLDVNLDLFCALPATKYAQWVHLETLQLGKGTVNINMIIRSICQIQTLRNLSIRNSKFRYPYIVLDAIVHNLPELRQLDISFSNLLNTSDRHTDDLFTLLPKTRYAGSEETVLLGFVGMCFRNPLGFIGAFGCGGNCTYDWDRNVPIHQLLMPSNRNTACRTSVKSFRSCCWHSHCGTFFSSCTRHFIGSFFKRSLQQVQTIYHMWIESLYDQNTGAYASDWLDIISFDFMMATWFYFVLDRQQRNITLSRWLDTIHRPMKAKEEFSSDVFWGIGCCEPRLSSSKNQNVLPDHVLGKLVDCCTLAISWGDKAPDPFPWLLGLLLSLTDEAPAICRNLCSDRFRKRFMEVCKACIRPELHIKYNTYVVIGNVCEVEGLCQHFLREADVLDQLLIDCKDCDDDGVRSQATWILCWMLYYHEHTFTPEIQTVRNGVEQVMQTTVAVRRIGFDSLLPYKKLLTSAHSWVVWYALHSLHSIICQSDQNDVKRFCIMAYLQGLWKSIGMASQITQNDERIAHLATEILKAVDMAT